MRVWMYLLSVALVIASAAIMPEGSRAPIAAIFAYIAGWMASRLDGE